MKNKMFNIHFFRKFGIFFFSLFLFLCPVINLINAQQSAPLRFSVAPEKFELTVNRGQFLENDIKIINKNDFALPIEAKILNFGSEDYTGNIQFYEGLNLNQIENGEINDISFNPAKWIKISDPNFILEPAERKKVHFTIQVPESAEPGGHYAVIMFEPRLPSFYFEDEAFKVIPEVGVLFLFSVKVDGLAKIEEPLTIVEFAVPENLHLKKLENLVISLAGIISEARAEEKKPFSMVETSHLSFELQIKNSDIYHQKPEGSLVIKTSNDRIAGETEIKEITILPGKTRKIPIDFKPGLPEKIEKYLPDSVSQFISKNILFGKYQANLSLTTENSIIEENIEFWAFPWKVILSTGTVFLVLIIVVVKYRRRIFRSILVLFRK